MFVFWLRSLLLGSILAAALFFDLRSRRVPQTLVGLAVILGLLYRLGCGLALWTGLIPALVILVIGFLLYAWGMIGAADGKLLAVTALFYGWPTWWSYAGLLLVSALIIGAGYIIIRGDWKERLEGLAAYGQACLTAGRPLRYPKPVGRQGFPLTVCLLAAFGLHLLRGVLVWLGLAYVWRI
ncbi:MAG: prepilin peptidase [Lachnospiraceae bacterium]|nr:prepilin peptidase [Lachnospiraceae bacterium]MDY5742812.1 prepilin peptidase [Lachnospiraceae bacterium]